MYLTVYRRLELDSLSAQKDAVWKQWNIHSQIFTRNTQVNYLLMPCCLLELKTDEHIGAHALKHGQAETELKTIDEEVLLLQESILWSSV